jgi:hypothetical protein
MKKPDCPTAALISFSTVTAAALRVARRQLEPGTLCRLFSRGLVSWNVQFVIITVRIFAANVPPPHLKRGDIHRHDKQFAVDIRMWRI